MAARPDDIFPALPADRAILLHRLHDGLLDWNQRINLVSRKDVDHLMVRHVLHSLTLAPFIHERPGHRILDVGTGGGLPGLVLAIALPDREVVLVDSIAKKIGVVQALIDDLGLVNARAVRARVERLPGDRPFDHVVSRAVARTAKLLAWTRHLRHAGTHCWFLKGGDLREELAAVDGVERLDLQGVLGDDFDTTKCIIHQGPGATSS